VRALLKRNQWITYGVYTWCKRGQAQARASPSHQSPFSQIQTPTCGASPFCKPIRQVCAAGRRRSLNLITVIISYAFHRRCHLKYSLSSSSSGHSLICAGHHHLFALLSPLRPLVVVAMKFFHCRRHHCSTFVLQVSLLLSPSPIGLWSLSLSSPYTFATLSCGTKRMAVSGIATGS
jgi:hypothetical protein